MQWIWGPQARVGLAIALVTLVADQVNKWWMIYVYGIAERGRVEVLPFLDFVFVKNEGISYGLGTGAIAPWMLALFAFVASAALWIWLTRPSSTRLLAVSLALIIGGAIGNGIDRLHLGGVADFYLLHGFGFSWYVFNIADVAIVVGVIGLLYDSLISSRNDAAKAP